MFFHSHRNSAQFYRRLFRGLLTSVGRRRLFPQQSPCGVLVFVDRPFRFVGHRLSVFTEFSFHYDDTGVPAKMRSPKLKKNKQTNKTVGNSANGIVQRVWGRWAPASFLCLTPAVGTVRGLRSSLVLCAGGLVYRVLPGFSLAPANRRGVKVETAAAKWPCSRRQTVE